MSRQGEFEGGTGVVHLHSNNRGHGTACNNRGAQVISHDLDDVTCSSCLKAYNSPRATLVPIRKPGT